MTTQRTEKVEIGDDGAMTMDVWLPAAGRGPAMLLIQEIFGVGPYIRAVGARLAEAGYVVGAPDVFWRFAPGWASDHDQAGLAHSIEQVAKMDAQRTIADCLVAAEHLAVLAETDGRPGVIGFCMGGTLAFGVAAAGEPAVCVSYYGSGVPAMLDLLDSVTCPTLFHFGASDAYIPAQGVEALAERLGRRPGLVLNVETAGHAFDNHEAPMFYEEASARAAWSKTMAFLGEHLPVS